MSTIAAAEWVPGIVHPTGGYDQISRDDDGRTTYLLGERLHRLDGPAVVDDEDGFIVSEGYYVNGSAHRADGPALRINFADGSVSREDFYVEGKKHRLDGPASATFYPNGAPHTVKYYVEGKLHRLEGPAKVRLAENGFEIEAFYFVRGGHYDSATHARLVEALDSGAPLEWAEAYALGEADS